MEAQILSIAAHLARLLSINPDRDALIYQAFCLYNQEVLLNRLRIEKASISIILVRLLETAGLAVVPDLSDLFHFREVKQEKTSEKQQSLDQVLTTLKGTGNKLESGIPIMGDIPHYQVLSGIVSEPFGIDVSLSEDGKLEVKYPNLPVRVKGLILFPLKNPHLFEIETGMAPWEIWHILEAFRSEYFKIYANPAKYGVSSSYPLVDLSIEEVYFFPSSSLLTVNVDLS